VDKDKGKKKRIEQKDIFSDPKKKDLLL